MKALLKVMLAAMVATAASAFEAADWKVEQQPGGAVEFNAEEVRILDRGGCTVWYRTKLTAPVVIRYQARLLPERRVSDLNCFWMATDPAIPSGSPLEASRRGRFAEYDSLRTYYVGLGGNANTTTRFRRYDGTGARPLLPGHDLSAPEFLLEGGRTYEIRIEVLDTGETRYLRDGRLIFAWTDPAPLREGWFGLRTVDSGLVISHFSVETSPAPLPSPTESR